jgi:ribosomal protein S8
LSIRYNYISRWIIFIFYKIWIVFFLLLEDKFKSNKDILSPLPLKKKVKIERGLIKSYFNQIKKSDDEEKENKSRRQLKCTISDKNILTNETNITKKRRNKTKQDELPRSSPLNFLSSIQVEKTSLILFDEVCIWFFK